MRGLVEGHEDEKDKRRIRYTLTTEALAHLGISSLNELPRAEELSLGVREAAVEPVSASETV
jgi:chromosome segregation and condensation protein ScpB